MTHYPEPFPALMDGRCRWGRAVVAGRIVRLRADVRNRRVVIRRDLPEPVGVGVVIGIEPERDRPLLLLNPRQRPWAGAAEVRGLLLDAALAHYRTVEETA